MNEYVRVVWESGRRRDEGVACGHRASMRSGRRLHTTGVRGFTKGHFSICKYFDNDRFQLTLVLSSNPTHSAGRAATGQE